MKKQILSGNSIILILPFMGIGTKKKIRASSGNKRFFKSIPYKEGQLPPGPYRGKFVGFCYQMAVLRFKTQKDPMSR